MLKQLNNPADFPLVSIVIPTFNTADYLCEAIDSVLNQSYPNVELIVLDDGSSDGTPELLKDYPEELFYRESHANMGQSATLNKGWAMAHGEILGYLSADDALLSDAVKTMVECFDQFPDRAMVYCDYVHMDEHSRAVRTIRLPDFNYRKMVLHSVCLPGPGALWRRSAFERSGAWDGNLHQIPDYDFWLRLGLQGDFHHVSQVLARFRVHADSQTCGIGDSGKSEEIVTVLERYFQRSDIPMEVSSSCDQALANAHIFSASLHLKAGRCSDAFRHVWKAFRMNFSSLFYFGNLRRLMVGFRLYLGSSAD